MSKKQILFILPLAIFLVLGVLFYIGLDKDPSIVPSPLINKAAPPFTLPSLSDNNQVNPIEKFYGKVWTLNVWASWCTACRVEHPVFIKARKDYPNWLFIGLNYQDKTLDAKKWLNELGDPYTISLVDRKGRVGINWGVYGVPETFIIDKKGYIRYKHIGPVSQQQMDEIIMPKINELKGK